VVLPEPAIPRTITHVGFLFWSPVLAAAAVTEFEELALPADAAISSQVRIDVAISTVNSLSPTSYDWGRVQIGGYAPFRAHP